MSMLLALLTGAVISVMVSINGGLTACVGEYAAAVIIHVVGTGFALILCLLRRERIFARRHAPAWAYLGGVIGVLTTFFNNFAFGRISVTNITALGLLGQTVTAALMDGLGLLGMPRRRIAPGTWLGIGISVAGVAVMLDASIADAALAVLLSIAAGVTNVFSRTVNARLSQQAGALTGSFFNHLTGLPCCLLLWLLAGGAGSGIAAVPAPWMLCGGMLGVAVVLLLNITVPRIAAFRLTLLSFLGQIFTGFAIDLALGQSVSGGLFWGGVICATGLLATMAMEALGKG